MIEHLQRARRHRRRAAADPRLRRRPPSGRAQARATTGATTRSASSRRSRATRSDNALDEFRATVARAARRRHRGDPRRRLQPHRRGQPSRARRCRFRGIDNASYYWLQPDKPRYYDDFTGCGNTLNLTPSARAADGDGFAALLGRGLPCRRLPLRPRHHARRADRTASIRNAAFFDRDPAGSGAGHRQADRRAVGRRPRRLSGRRLSVAAGRNGTTATATRCGATGAAKAA